MLVFWFLAGTLLVAALGVLLWPLLRTQRGGAEPDADSAAIAVFRDQKRAADQDFASGAISHEEPVRSLDCILASRDAFRTSGCSTSLALILTSL